MSFALVRRPDDVTTGNDRPARKNRTRCCPDELEFPKSSRRRPSSAKVGCPRRCPVPDNDFDSGDVGVARLTEDATRPRSAALCLLEVSRLFSTKQKRQRRWIVSRALHLLSSWCLSDCLMNVFSVTLGRQVWLCLRCCHCSICSVDRPSYVS